MEILGILLRGFVMGCADVVPGVSGGTVALITGIYTRLIAAIHSVVKGFYLILHGKFKEGTEAMDLLLLVPLFIGIVVAFLSMAKPIIYFMTEHKHETWAVFLGLMIGSVWIVFRMVKEWNFLHISLVAMCAMIAYQLTLQKPAQATDDQWGYFIAGAIAICAMILPGVSGSFLLLIMGKYYGIIQSLNHLLSGNIKEFAAVIVPFGLGCVCGLAVFSWALNQLLKHYHSMMMSILLGLMVGSLQKLWPYRDVFFYLYKGDGKMKVLQDHARLPYYYDTQFTIVITLIAVSAIAVLLIDFFGKRVKKAKVATVN